MTTGILFGLGAALLQSVSYLLSAIFISRYKSGATTHLIIVHIIVGVFALLLLPFIWHPLALEIEGYWLALLGAAATYMFGQFSLYKAIQHSVASRVSPLLGLKILVVAFIGITLLGHEYQWLQWLAVSISVMGAIWLSASGGRVSKKAIGWVVATCTGYAVSDICIYYLIQHFSSMPLLSAAMLSVALCYSLCGLCCLAFWRRLKQPQEILASTPAAITWFFALSCLFACFAELGVVFGGIVQSSRGIISILLTIMLASLSWGITDPLPPRKILLQRIAAASLMTLAIALFSITE